MGIIEEGRAVQVNTQIVSAFDLWFPKQADQRVLWPSTVRLSEEYFQSLGRHAVPLDHRAVAALSVVLDGARHLCLAGPAAAPHPPGKPSSSPGSRIRAVRTGLRPRAGLPPAFLHTLSHVKSAYPSAHISNDEHGLTLEHSSPPVARADTGFVPGAKSAHGKLVAPSAETELADSREKGVVEAPSLPESTT